MLIITGSAAQAAQIQGVIERFGPRLSTEVVVR